MRIDYLLLLGIPGLGMIVSILLAQTVSSWAALGYAILFFLFILQFVFSLITLLIIRYTSKYRFVWWQSLLLSVVFFFLSFAVVFTLARLG